MTTPAPSDIRGVLDISDKRATTPNIKLAVVIPCYKVSRQLGAVVGRISPDVLRVYCVVDGCPEGSGAIADELAAQDSRIQVLRHSTNQGVGAAVVTGYAQAIQDGMEIVVKLDGDGQMAPERIGELIEPILRGEADYVKGNRFFHLEDLRSMPWPRLIGNAGLSFLSKLSSGYWNLFDPTNGFTAIHHTAISLLPLNKISKRYFFESDILFRLNSLRAVVLDVPLKAYYADEESNLSIGNSLAVFPVLHARNFFKRLLYNYFLRDFNLASLNLVVGILLVSFGSVFGAVRWIRGYELNLVASPGTVMLAALPVVLGWQSLMGFINFDLSNVLRRPIQQNRSTLLKSTE